MKHIVLAVFVFSTVAASRAEETNVVGTTYSFTIPTDVTFKSETHMEFYTFKWGNAPRESLLQLSRLSKMLSTQEFESLEHSLKQSLAPLSMLRGRTRSPETERHNLRLGPFTGYEYLTSYPLPDGSTLLRSVLRLNDPNCTWTGRITGYAATDIARAHSIMTHAKKITNKTNGE